MKRDCIIIVSILLLAGILILIMNRSKEKGAYVRVTIDGKETASYELGTDARIPIYCSENDYNILVIADGKAYMEEANCPDKLCVKQAKISCEAETIVCLPHKLVVDVLGGKKRTLDSVTY